MMPACTEGCAFYFETKSSLHARVETVDFIHLHSKGAKAFYYAINLDNNINIG